MTRPSAHRGLVFDAAAFVANTAAAVWLADRLSEGRVDSPGLRALVVAALVAQAVGAGLKGPALDRRRGPRPHGALAAPLLASALLLNLAVSVALLLGTRVSPWLLPLALFSTACLGVALAPGARREPEGAVPAGAEALGDVLLWLAAETVLVVFAAFLAPLVTWREAGPRLRDEVPLGLGVAVATAFQVLFFYAPFRLLQLREDGRRLTTWLQMALAVLPLQLQVVRSWRELPLRLSCSPGTVVARGEVPGEARCRVAAGPRFTGPVLVDCRPLDGDSVTCSASPASLTLAAGEVATVRLEMVPVVPRPGETAMQVWVGSREGGVERDAILWLRVEPEAGREGP